MLRVKYLNSLLSHVYFLIMPVVADQALTALQKLRLGRLQQAGRLRKGIAQLQTLLVGWLVHGQDSVNLF